MPRVTSTVASSSRYTSAQASVESTPPRLASPLPPGPPALLPPPLPQPDHDEPSPEPPRPPEYRMCRTVKTVKALWQEWTVGLGHGNPSVKFRRSTRFKVGQSMARWEAKRAPVVLHKARGH